MSRSTRSLRSRVARQRNSNLSEPKRPALVKEAYGPSTVLKDEKLFNEFIQNLINGTESSAEELYENLITFYPNAPNFNRSFPFYWRWFKRCR